MVRYGRACRDCDGAQSRSYLRPKFSAGIQAYYAPNWGRLHLKWGQALFYAGRKAEAVKQIGIAAALDLSPTDKVPSVHAKGLHG